MRLRKKLKLLWVIISITGIMIAYLIGLNYFTSIAASKKSILNKLKAVTCTASLYIDTDAHQRVVSKYKNKDDIQASSDDDDYQLLHEQLSNVQKLNMLSTPVYTLTYDSLDQSIQFIATSADKPYFRHNYSKFPMQLIDEISQGGILDTYESEHGIWLSAFAPIVIGDHKVIGIVHADEEFGGFIAQANKQLIVNLGIALAVIVPLFILLYKYTKRFLINQTQYEERLIKQQESIAEQSTVIKNQNQQILSVNAELDTKVRVRTRQLLLTTRELETFLYRSSHDIRGPLATLAGLCYLNRLEQSNNYNELIYDASLKLSHRIKSISEVHDIKSCKILHKSICMLEELTSVIDSYPPQETTKWRCCVDVDHELNFFVDVDLFKVIVKEIIDNSIKHNTRCVLIDFIAHKNEKEIILEVRDNGVGADQRVLQNAFKMFYRGNEKSDGAGLGLYKVKLAMLRLGGKVEVVERPGGIRNVLRFSTQINSDTVPA